IYGLVTAGFLHRTGTSSTAPQVRDARIEEHRNLGVAFYRTGMFDEAERVYRRVEELRPADPDASLHLGLIALRKARWPEALTALKRARELGGPRRDICHNLGLALEQLGDLDEAEAAWEEAVGEEEDPRCLTGWGILALKREDWPAARDRLGRARAAFGDRTPPALWFWAASLAATLEEDTDESVSIAREGIAAHPSEAVLRNNLAVLLEGTGDLAAADLLLREAMEEAPALPQIAKNLGDLLYRAGRYDEALEHYERVKKLAPALGDDLYFKLGNIAYRRHDPDAARTHWERAVELNPGHELARTNLETLGAVA
ncbi:MAG: tetratricopeptide repeat protein, partial [Gemmatimonadales bacterium]